MGGMIWEGGSAAWALLGAHFCIKGA